MVIRYEHVGDYVSLKVDGSAEEIAALTKHSMERDVDLDITAIAKTVVKDINQQIVSGGKPVLLL